MMALNPPAKQPELPGAVPGDAPTMKRQIISFLEGFSIEIMPRAAVQMASIRDHLQPETKAYVTFVPGSDFADVITTAKRLRQEGFNPVPHFVARGIASREQFEEQLKRVCTKAGVDEVLVIGGDLGNFLRTLALPEAAEHWSLTTLREKLIKIGAKVVRHGRYITFQMAEVAIPSQMAEVAIPRPLFAEILRLIDGLRQRLYRHDGAPSSSIQVARQDRRVLPRQRRALTARNGDWTGFSIAKSARQSREIAMQRAGSRPDSPSTTICAAVLGKPVGSSGKCQMR
jgi:hypothetical protein